LHKFTFRLTTHPDDERPVYLAGNFNNWTVQDENTRMIKHGNGHYSLDVFGHINFPLEYKYTRGAWNQVEMDEYGNPRENHVVEKPIDIIMDKVHFWQLNGELNYPPYFPKIELISDKFEIPQLIKTRRIAALLPYDYYETDKKYPVLYLQDGQNLFDDHAPFGSWEVDKKLALMQRKGIGDVIVIAIDHAKEERIEEYNPGGNPKLGKGQGREYVRF